MPTSSIRPKDSNKLLSMGSDVFTPYMEIEGDDGGKRKEIK